MKNGEGKFLSKPNFWGIKTLNIRCFPDLSPLLFYFLSPNDKPASKGRCGGLFWCFRSNPLLFITLRSFFFFLFCAVSFSDALNMSFKLLVETVGDVYTVEQLKQKALQSDGKLEPVYGIIYGYISTLDIDDNASKVIRNRW